LPSTSHTRHLVHECRQRGTGCLSEINIKASNLCQYVAAGAGDSIAEQSTSLGRRCHTAAESPGIGVSDRAEADVASSEEYHEHVKAEVVIKDTRATNSWPSISIAFLFHEPVLDS
jgi:hypothetical protein